MLNLYCKTYCPYSARVIAANEQIKAPLQLLDIYAEPQLRSVLLEKGGKNQVPFLEDTERGVSLYESLDIIEYLHTHYGSGTAPVVQTVAHVCPIE